jgi:arginyl-tRNA synthetase
VESVGEDCHTLGVTFDEYLGESDSMPCVRFVEHALTARNTLVESDGAMIVNTSHGALMFRNSEGGYLYAATDLATVILRDGMMPDHGTHHALYVVDERQALHFKQVFEVAQQFSPATLEHVGFGTVNGPDGKPFKTRAGGVPKLADLMSEAISKAAERNPKSAKAVALAAIKFGDLINRRTGSYAFDIDKSLRFEGKTGAYMLYQVARIRSIIRQAEVRPGYVEITDADERALALHLLDFFPTVEKAGETRMPHLLAEYAYELSQRFARFYAGAPIKSSPSRLTLAKSTEAYLSVALDLLGIETVNEM